MNKTKIKIWHIVVFLLIIVIGVTLMAVDFLTEPTKKIIANGDIYRLLVADTPGATFQGLSDRESLGEYDGMVFIFPRADYHTMVMRRMSFSIDIVWLNRGIIVDIAPEVAPQFGVAEDYLTSYRPRLVADMILELRAGLVREWGWKIGDHVEIFN